MKRNEIIMRDNTIFDDVLRTMQERHPRLSIPLVNEVFNENYEDGEKVVRLPEEYQKIISKLILDSYCVIHKNIYHFECQSGTDCSIAPRMVEYDFMIAIGNAKKVDDVFRAKFPKSCVIYLRSENAEKERLWLNIELMDGQVVKYEVPVIRICDYTLDEIFKKKLYIFLPFYVLRYEKSFDQIANDIERMNNLTQEFVMIVNKLQEELGNMEDGICQDILSLMQRIVNYELRDDYKLKERVNKLFQKLNIV